MYFEIRSMVNKTEAERQRFVGNICRTLDTYLKPIETELASLDNGICQTLVLLTVTEANSGIAQDWLRLVQLSRIGEKAKSSPLSRAQF